MKMKQIGGSVALSVIVFLVCSFAVLSTASAAETVTVFAAASTTNAVSEIGQLFVEKKLGKFLPSFASSSTLAKQIDNGAPASVYISANEKWMDYLAKRGDIDTGSRYNLLGNRLVLIAPSSSALTTVKIRPGFKLKDLLAGGYLAMGNPAHVPAGIYGKQALETLGVWKTVSGHIARQRDVRSALALVERGEVPLGVVYATDAAITHKVKIVGRFPADSHPPIVYPVALVKGGETVVARAFINFLKSPAARAVFKKYGFTLPR